MLPESNASLRSGSPALFCLETNSETRPANKGPGAPAYRQRGDLKRHCSSCACACACACAHTCTGVPVYKYMFTKQEEEEVEGGGRDKSATQLGFK